MHAFWFALLVPLGAVSLAFSLFRSTWVWAVLLTSSSILLGIMLWPEFQMVMNASYNSTWYDPIAVKLLVNSDVPFVQIAVTSWVNLMICSFCLKYKKPINAGQESTKSVAE